MSTLITQKIWRILPVDSLKRKALGKDLGIHPIMAQLLINRGMEDRDAAVCFLQAGEKNFHDPFLLKDMGTAIERVRLAHARGETVLIFGDYDVDGITASVVLRQALDAFGVKAINHIPDRMDDGYGLNDQAADVARQCGASLVISVDCGITALRPAAILKKNGIDLIIIDHHEPTQGKIPDAVAVIDPKQADCPYPFKHLAAVGLAAKFTQALRGKIPAGILTFVALGTIADVVPLHGENRAFVKLGLPQLEKTRNKGLRALFETSRIAGKVFKPYHAGFIIGPRINAAGRMGSARRALDLLLTTDDLEALRLARELEEINMKRQQLQRRIIQEAMSMIEREIDLDAHKVIVLAKEGWHKGVLGIVASRVTETFSRPAIVVALAEGWGTGSARSIDGFHLNEALAACSDILKEFGGHRLAAGLTFHENHLEQFRERINAYAADAMVHTEMLPVLTIDGDIVLSELDVELVRMIDLLEPYGEGNRAPVFCSRDVIIKSRPVVLAKDTLKFLISDGNQTLSAVGFGMGRYQAELSFGQRVDLAYELAIDDWNKDPVVQLKLKDIQLK